MKFMGMGGLGGTNQPNPPDLNAPSLLGVEKALCGNKGAYSKPSDHTGYSIITWNGWGWPRLRIESEKLSHPKQ